MRYQQRLLITLGLIGFVHQLIAPLAPAAINQNTSIQVFPGTGNSTNGGGFVNGASGTNYSLFQNKNASGCSSCGSSTVNLSTTDAVAVGSATITSLTGNFSSAIVGNVIYFQGGTGSLAAVRREVLTFTNSTTIVLDASVAAGTGITMNIGGALDDISTALLFNTAYNVICVLNNGTTLQTNAGYTLNNGVSPGSPTYNRIWGYTTTCGDHLGGTIQLITNTGLTAFNGSGVQGWWIDGLTIDCNSLGTSSGLSFPSGQAQFTNLLVKNCKTTLLSAAAQSNVINCEFTGFSTGTTAITLSGNINTFKRNYVHDNAATSEVLSATTGAYEDNVFDTNTGANTDCITMDTGANTERNVFYKCGRDGMRVAGSAGHNVLGQIHQGNIFSENGRYGMNCASGTTANPTNDYNAYFSNGTAATLGCDATTPAYAYTGQGNVTLSVDPFTDAPNGIFTLNSTAGGGADLKGTATPGTIKGATGTGYMSFGPYQVQASGGGSGNSAYVQ